MQIENFDIDRAIAKGEFLPNFQPVVNLRSGHLCGFELLARWNHPEHGWIQPDQFIPLAEKHGWIHRLTCDLLRKGFRAASEFPPSLAGRQDLTLAINISPLQLHDPNLPGIIESLAAQGGFPLRCLMIEITESALTEDIDVARTVVNTLKEMGCRLALDDFGTNYSSLSTLQSLPFDELKVDRSFISSMTEKRDSRKIVAAVVGLGQSLGMTTVAEGIETPEQAEMLRWLGCELGQGWLYGKPVPASQLASVIAGFASKPPAVWSCSVEEDVAGRVSAASLDALPAQRLAQLRAVYDGAPVGLAFIDRRLRYLNINRRLATINGRPMEDHLGRTVVEMIPDFYPSIESFLQRALGGESIQGFEVTTPDSETKPGNTLLLSYEPARDEGDEVVGISVAVIDVTPLKRAEEARRETEEHFRNMLELLPQIPWIIDSEGRALDVSHRWREIAGMTGEKWRGFGWLDALHPDDVQPTLDAMRRSFATGHPIDLQYRIRRSEQAPWQRMRSRGSPRIEADGKIHYWYGYLEPIDEVN